MGGTDGLGLAVAPIAKKPRKSGVPKNEPEPVVAPAVKKPRKSRDPIDPSSLLTLQKDTVRRVMDQETDLRVSNEAVDLTRFYAEEYIRKLAYNANICASFQRRRTILDIDVNAAIKMR